MILHMSDGQLIGFPTTPEQAGELSKLIGDVWNGQSNDAALLLSFRPGVRGRTAINLRQVAYFEIPDDAAFEFTGKQM